jgi:hypothetical protein
MAWYIMVDVTEIVTKIMLLVASLWVLARCPRGGTLSI